MLKLSRYCRKLSNWLLKPANSVCELLAISISETRPPVLFAIDIEAALLETVHSRRHREEGNARLARRLNDSWPANEGKFVCNFDTTGVAVHARRSARE